MLSSRIEAILAQGQRFVCKRNMNESEFDAATTVADTTSTEAEVCDI